MKLELEQEISYQLMGKDQKPNLERIDGLLN